MESKTNKNIILLVCALGAFATPFISSSVNVALPSIGKEFAMNASQLNWVATSFLLASAIFVAPFGRAADILGRKKIYLLGILCFTLSSILCGLSVSTVMLIGARVLQGIAAAAIFGTSTAILTSAFPPNERGKALGISVAVTYVGLSFGPFLGGFLTQHLGWRSIFFVNVPLGVLIIILIMVWIKEEWVAARNEKIDYIGVLIYGVGLLLLMVGMSSITDRWKGPLFLLTGYMALWIFGVVEGKTENPIINMTLLKSNKVLVFSLLAALINYCATFAITYLLSLYLQYIKGFDPQTAGMVLLAQPVVQALLSPFAGRLSDRLAPQKVASMGMALTAVSLALLALINNDTHISLILVATVILGFGFALFASPNTNATMSAVEPKFYGVASGLLGTARLVGQTFSMGITAVVFSLYLGNVQITKEYHPHFAEGVKIVFLILALLSVMAVFFSLAGIRRMRKEAGNSG